MTKKELRAHRGIVLEIKQLEQQIKELQSTVYRVKSVVISQMPHSRDKVDFSDLLVKLIDLKKLYIEKHVTLMTEKQKIENAIENLGNFERTLMRLRYIDGKEWEEVCCKINYSWKQTHRMHSKILERLKDDTP